MCCDLILRFLEEVGRIFSFCSVSFMWRPHWQAMMETWSPRVVILAQSSSAHAFRNCFHESGLVGLGTVKLRLEF